MAIKFYRDYREWMLRLVLVSAAFFWLALIAGAWAEAEDFGDNSGSNSRRSSENSAEDEYNFSWLDPDKKIYVLQNRKYLKGGHPLLSVMGGVGFSNPYRSTYNFDPRFAYYMNETWGIELFYTLTSNIQNSTYQALAGTGVNVLPSVREIRSQYGGMIHYVPWYAKINVFNSLLYFDWYFGAGVGTVQSFVDTRKLASDSSNFVQDNLFAVFLSTGHEYHLSQSFIVRIDMTAAIYQAHINGLSGDSSWYSNLNFGLGFGWRL